MENVTLEQLQSLVNRAFEIECVGGTYYSILKSVKLIEDNFSLGTHIIDDKYESLEIVTESNISRSERLFLLDCLNGKYEEVSYIEVMSQYHNSNVDSLGEKVNQATVNYKNAKNDKFQFYEDNIQLVLEKYRSQIEGRCFYVIPDGECKEFRMFKYDSFSISNGFIYLIQIDKFFNNLNLEYDGQEQFEERNTSVEFASTPKLLEEKIRLGLLIETTLENFNNNIPLLSWKL